LARLSPKQKRPYQRQNSDTSKGGYLTDREGYGGDSTRAADQPIDKSTGFEKPVDLLLIENKFS
jgi:hypothetical protein